MAPGAKFSTMTSARFAMFLTSSSPRSDFRLTVMDFLLALNNRKYQESWFWLWSGPGCRPIKERPASPPCGFSTFTTSAPSQASASVQDGPASNWVRSRTRTPARKEGNPPFVAIFSFLRRTRHLDRPLRTASLRLDAGFLDDWPPLLDLGLLLRGESRRCLLLARPGSLAHVGHPLAHRRIGQRLHHSSVELADGILGRALGRPEAVPERGVQPGDSRLVDGRRLGRCPPSLLGHYHIGLDLAGAHLRQRDSPPG